MENDLVVEKSISRNQSAIKVFKSDALIVVATFCSSSFIGWLPSHRKKLLRFKFRNEVFAKTPHFCAYFFFSIACYYSTMFELYRSRQKKLGNFRASCLNDSYSFVRFVTKKTHSTMKSEYETKQKVNKQLNLFYFRSSRLLSFAFFSKPLYSALFLVQLYQLFRSMPY